MAYRKLGRTSSQRKAMLRDLTTDLLINESIVTTEARAKEIRKTVEKMITLGKRGDLHARRQAAAFVRSEIASENYDEATDKYTATTALQKLFDDIAPRYAERNGGYTRIVKIGQRKGDGALEVLLELV